MMWRSLIIALTLTGIASASEQGPTRDQLLQTVRHIQSLAHDIQNDLDQEKAQHAITQKALDDANSRAETLAKHDATVTAQLNKAEKSLWWYRLHWWGAWIALGTGVIAICIVAFLKFTGRLSLSAAQIAAKL
jgi:hypothetical protein